MPQLAVSRAAMCLAAQVAVLVALKAPFPMMSVVNHSFQGIFGDNEFCFEGFNW